MQHAAHGGDGGASDGPRFPASAGAPVGAIAFIHRFGSSLNGHVHLHVCVVDGVFEEVAAHYLWADAPDRIHYRGHANPQDP